MSKLRKDVAPQDKWNVEALYPSLEAWREEFEQIAPATSPRYPSMISKKGTLGGSPASLKAFLDDYLKLSEILSKLYTYAHLKHDEDIADNDGKMAYSEAIAAYSSFQEETAWFNPELIALPEAKIQEYLKAPELQDYNFFLEKIFRMKPHTLSADKELLMAMSGKALSSMQRAFSALNDADFKFGTILDKAGLPHDLTHAQYGLYLRSNDRTLRENAFKTYHGKYHSYENTLAELLNGQIESHVFNAKARGFPSALDAALFPHNVNPSVYHALIKAVNDDIDALHRYIKLRGKVLNLHPLQAYDLQIPLVKDFDMKIPYDQAVDLVIESVKPLGVEYQNTLAKGLKTDRWVDKFENQNKRSGAYSSGCYGSMPYILMNYKNIIRDLFTLTHEAGHSMHSYFSRKCQPYQYSHYSIFVAEVASTFNEELLMQTMLKNASTREEKIFLLTQKIEDIRGTLFRQTQFAEFELLLHTFAEKNIPITPDLLKGEYQRLNQIYYGPDLEQTDGIASEWSRIPHFYYNFYVYQYATGVSAALSLADRVLQGGAKEQEDYLRFLKSGDSVHPIDALKIAGVDMTSVAPVKHAIAKFRSLLDQLEALLVEEPKLALK